MGEVSVESNAVSNAIKQCQAIQTGLKCETAKMLRQYETLGSGWNDEKYRELGQIVHKCSDALKQPLSELQKCEAFLARLHNIISEYESIHFSSNGGMTTSSSSSCQYSSISQGSGVSNRRYSRMSEAASRNVDYQHERSLRNYCLDGHQEINGYLRGTNTREFSTEYLSIVQDDINNLTETLNEHRLGRNMTLYRGVSNPRYIIGDNWRDMSIEEINSSNIGRVFHDDGFCSTSVDPNGAADFSQSWTGATMIIQAPADANGMCVGSYNNRVAEREVLLQRGSNFRIDGISRDRYGNCVIRTTLIGRGG